MLLLPRLGYYSFFQKDNIDCIKVFDHPFSIHLLQHFLDFSVPLLSTSTQTAFKGFVRQTFEAVCLGTMPLYTNGSFVEYKTLDLFFFSLGNRTPLS